MDAAHDLALSLYVRNVQASRLKQPGAASQPCACRRDDSCSCSSGLHASRKECVVSFFLLEVDRAAFNEKEKILPLQNQVGPSVSQVKYADGRTYGRTDNSHAEKFFVRRCKRSASRSRVFVRMCGTSGPNFWNGALLEVRASA